MCYLISYYYYVSCAVPRAPAGQARYSLLTTVPDMSIVGSKLETLYLTLFLPKWILLEIY